MHSAFPEATPESQELSSSALWRMLDELEQKELEVTSMRLIVNGCLILSFCRKPYKPDCRQLWFSTTKAFTGIGVGIACDRGLISLDDFVVSFFPDKLPETVSENLRAMRVRHLLSMSCGIHENTYAELYPQEDWVKAFLAQEFPHEPGAYYRYSTHASHMLAAIVEKASGIRFFDFIKTYLMGPLDIDDMTWEVCRQGITCGGMGLGITTEAVARFGYMLLKHGIYRGKRIVSQQYLSEALTEQIDNRKLETKRHANGYGFHMCIDHDGSFYHEGSFGQLCYVSPGRNAVLAVTSRKRNWDDVIDLFHSLFSPTGITNQSISYDRLQKRLQTMSYPLPAMLPVPSDAFRLDGKTYIFDDNELGLRRVGFKQENNQSLNMYLEYANREPGSLSFSFTGPSHGWDFFVKDIQIHRQKYVSFGAWQDAGTLLLTVFYIETPYVVTYTAHFDGESVEIRYQINVSFGIRDCSINGKIAVSGPHF